MGIDKANVRTIIHFGAPASLVGGGRRAGDSGSRERRLWGPAGAGLPSIPQLALTLYTELEHPAPDDVLPHVPLTTSLTGGILPAGWAGGA